MPEAASLPMLLSSDPRLRHFVSVVLLGLIVAVLFFFTAAFSVWCFFVGLASLMLYRRFALAGQTT